MPYPNEEEKAGKRATSAEAWGKAWRAKVGS